MPTQTSWPLTIVHAILSSLLITSFTGMNAESLQLTLRSQQKGSDAKVTQKSVSWEASNTAVVICDMWDDHWCRSAARRVVEMAPSLNATVQAARAKGALIIHAPSSVTAFYRNTPQRKRAQTAPFTSAPVALSTAERWGTTWCWPDPEVEAVLPIDDSDMGCSCLPEKCVIRDAWTRQIDLIDIHPRDAITDHGQETVNLLAAHGIDNVILCGVHLNMCVLGRPFGIRQMVKLGKNVALIRDLTDTMYNPERPPGVDHFAGTDLVIAHVEKFWCPSILSSDITNGAPFRFQEDKLGEPSGGKASSRAQK